MPNECDSTLLRIVHFWKQSCSRIPVLSYRLDHIRENIMVRQIMNSTSFLLIYEPVLRSLNFKTFGVSTYRDFCALYCIWVGL